MSDVDENSGTLLFIPGTHRVSSDEANPRERSAQPDFWAEFDRIKDALGRNVQALSVAMGQGCFSLHHWDTIHGSYLNTTAQPRLAVSLAIGTDKLAVHPEKDEHGYTEHLNDNRKCPLLFG